jgi:hypothetical protein
MEGLMTRSAILVLALTALGIPVSAAGQSGDRIDRGTRIRVVAPTISRRPQVGNLAAMDSTGLHLLQGGDAVTVPWNAVLAVDVSTGRRSHWVRGAAIGGLSGLAVATVAFVADQSDSQDDPFSDALDQVFFPAAAFVLGASGALVGGVIGAIARTEQWEQIPATNLRWGVGPVAGGGVRLMLTLRL